MSYTVVSISRAFIMIVSLGCVVNNEGVIMRLTGTCPVYTRLCVKICHWDCIELDFCMFREYNGSLLAQISEILYYKGFHKDFRGVKLKKQPYKMIAF